jgi:capsular polysaccharide biosynthesis protein
MSPPSKKNPEAFNFPIPIDPLRLLYGVRQRWLWFVILPIIFGGLGWFAGGLKTENRYSVSLQLIKSEVPTTVQTSESGQAFKPRELSDDTLLSTTYSTEVLKRTAARLIPERSPGEVKSMVEIAKQRNTSLFYLTAHSRVSAEDAINTVRVWAEEVIRFTNNLQREEARQMAAFISEQLDAIEGQLAQVNQLILEFAKKNKFVDVDKQTETALSTLENTRMQLANTRIALETKDVQIRRYREELRAQSPLEADLKKKREELTFLRGRYTDENPLVKEKLYEIEYINNQLEATASADVEDLKNFTGSDLGNNLYLEIIALQNERTQLENMLKSLEQRLAEQELLVADLPEKALRLSELKSRRDLLIDAQALLDSRRKEASFYETKAPGYWRVFQEPNLDEVAHSSQNVKALLLGFIGFSGGLAIAFLAALFWEALQPGLRTPLEAAIATAALPIFNYVTKGAKKPSCCVRHLFQKEESALNERALSSFWLTHAIAGDGVQRKRFLFIPTDVCDDEIIFWRDLLDLIESEKRQLTLISVSNGKGDPLESLCGHGAVKAYADKLAEIPEDPEELVFVRMAKIPTVEEVGALKSLQAYYLLNSPSIAERDETRHKSEIMRKLLGPANGLLIVDQEADNTLPRAIKWIELMILNHLASREPKAEEV